MKLERFEEILSWQKAQDLTLEIYRLTAKLSDYSFRDQLRRASVSIMNNIAEGFERRSNKEFKQFLFIAKGSCGECRSMLDLAKELGLIDQTDFEKAYSLSLEISRMLSGLIKTL